MGFIISGRRIGRMNSNNRNKGIWFGLYALLLLIMSVPLLCEYVPEGGDVLIWLEKIEHYNILGLTLTNKYRLLVLLINSITLLGTYELMQLALEEKVAAYFGTCFYVLCPYRIYICYDSVELDKAIQLMLLPILMIGLFAKGKLAVCKKVVSCVLLFGMFVYIVKEQNSYAIGEMLTTYTYADGNPGIGLGMLAGILLAIWLLYTESDRILRKEVGIVWLGSAFLFACYAMAMPFLAVFSARAIKMARKHEDKFVRICIPLMILFANFGVALYLCNNIVYTRYPMFLINSVMELAG